MAGSWWDLGAPVLQGLGVVLALVLGAANLAWLVIQGRQARDTKRLATEAHEWARERRDEEHAAAERQAAKLARFAEIAQELDLRAAMGEFSIDIPADLDPASVVEGEQLGFFRRVSGTLLHRGPLLARAKAPE